MQVGELGVLAACISETLEFVGEWELEIRVGASSETLCKMHDALRERMEELEAREKKGGVEARTCGEKPSGKT